MFLLRRVGVLCHRMACGARSRVQDASHRRQHCCASIEDQACCGLKLHLTAYSSWVGRWDDGGLGAAYYCFAARCCSSLPLLVLFSFCSSMFARVGVLGHRRDMPLCHACGMPPTGANIAVLLLKTWRAAGSTYTWKPSVVGLRVGMMAVRAVLCCTAAAVRVPCVCFHRGHQNVVLLPESAPESYNK